MQRTWLKSLFVVGCLMTIAACSHNKNQIKQGTPEKAEEVYNEAMADMDKEKYNSAIKQFERIEREYPYAKWAVRSQIMTAYAYYEQGKYDDAILAAEGFVRMHPGNEQVAYAYYLRALSYYEQIADIRRDQGVTLQARDAIREVIARFPDTDYARDMKLKLDLVQDHLAGKELEIGRYYLKQGNVIAAINRYRTVLDDYQTTNHVPEALYRLSEAYVRLGVIPEAQKYAAVLGYNYPSSKWYKYSYKLLKQNMPIIDSQPIQEEPKTDEEKASRLDNVLKTLGLRKS